MENKSFLFFFRLPWDLVQKYTFKFLEKKTFTLCKDSSLNKLTS